MAKALYWKSSRSINTPTNPTSTSIQVVPKCLHISPPLAKINNHSHKRNQIPPLISKKREKSPRHLITISTSDGKWHGKWNLDYIFSLQDLHLQDLAEDGHKDTQVSINLYIQKHTGFGLSIDGKIKTSLIRKCSKCSSPYCREIDTNFNLLVLPWSKKKDAAANQLPEIGGDDPSVMMVRPGYEAHLDVLIQDTIRLATLVKETCSESCEKSEPELQYIGAQNVASIHRRWSRLLELKNART